MPTTKCLSLVKGRRIRMTKLDGCGRPVVGDSSVIVSKGFISVAFSANTTDSDEISVTNAAGEVCVHEASITSLSGYGVEITFCEVDPDLFALATGQPVVTDPFSGNVVGFDIDTKTSLTAGGFALELWAGSQTAEACEPSAQGATGAFGYLLVPFLKGGIVGDFTVENNAVTFVLTGANTSDGNAWNTGPYNDIQTGEDGEPGPMLKPVSSTVALRTMLVDVAPPEAYCGSRPLMDASAAPLTAISATATGLAVDVDATPTNVAVWFDFGDGSWDYIESDAGGSNSHTYSLPGTYTIKATSDGKTWVEDEVIVG
jgi:hypothetical protein